MIRYHSGLFLGFFWLQIVLEAVLISLTMKLAKNYWQLILIIFEWPAAIVSLISIWCLWMAIPQNGNFISEAPVRIFDGDRWISFQWLHRSQAFQRCAWLLIASSSVLLGVIWP